jgi:glycosyltransferase involved in cell wall biosynthesis
MASKGRVVLFSNARTFGGAETYLVLLSEGLRRRGWDPVALIPEGEEGAVLGGRLGQRGVAVERYRRRGWASPSGAGEIAHRLRALAGGILHVNLPSPYEAQRSTVALWARLCGYRRVVATEHLPMSLRARRRVLLKVLLEPAVDTFIVLTPSGAEDLHRRHGIRPDRIALVPLGIDASTDPDPAERTALCAELGIPAGALLVAHVGALTARKGHRFLVEALSRLPDLLKAKNVHVLFVGGGEEREALERRVSQAGLVGRIHFLGHRDDARRIIGLIDLLVLPSLIETQPFSILEAMSAGTAVLATAIFGVPDLVVSGQTGLLVAPGEVGPLAGALAELLDDPSRRRNLGAGGRRRGPSGSISD